MEDLTGKRFYILGALQNLIRTATKAQIAQILGGTVSANIPNSDVVIMGGGIIPKEKLAEAKKHKVKLISETQYAEAIVAHVARKTNSQVEAWWNGLDAADRIKVFAREGPQEISLLGKRGADEMVGNKKGKKKKGSDDDDDDDEDDEHDASQGSKAARSEDDEDGDGDDEEIPDIAGKTIVFTGTLSVSRAEATKAAEKAGAKVAKTLVKSTDFVVVGDNAGAKQTEAEDKGIEVLDEEQFNKAVEKACGGGGGGGGGPKPKPGAKVPAPKKKVAVTAKKSDLDFFSGPAECPAFDAKTLATMEKELGLGKNEHLPEHYVEQMKKKNGGDIRARNVFKDKKGKRLCDITCVYGIAVKSSKKGMAAEQENWVDEWEYPTKSKSGNHTIVYFAETESGGHDMVAFEWHKHNAEPRVVHIDQEGNMKITPVAETFQEFCLGLVEGGDDADE